ncbi:MAG TPA: hypothetical protein VGG16_11115 [Streptosporangiaceae bacterium]|jgi:MFS family permease
MDITVAAPAAAAAGHNTSALPDRILAYVLFAYFAFAVVAAIASIFSRRWRRLAGRAVAIPLGAFVALYLVGRGIAEFFLVNYSDPASYHNAWGGPSLPGVFAVHSGPGAAIVIAATICLYRRHRNHHHAAVCPA